MHAQSDLAVWLENYGVGLSVLVSILGVIASTTVAAFAVSISRKATNIASAVAQREVMAVEYATEAAIAHDRDEARRLLLDVWMRATLKRPPADQLAVTSALHALMFHPPKGAERIDMAGIVDLAGGLSQGDLASAERARQLINAITAEMKDGEEIPMHPLMDSALAAIAESDDERERTDGTTDHGSE